MRICRSRLSPMSCSTSLSVISAPRSSLLLVRRCHRSRAKPGAAAEPSGLTRTRPLGGGRFYAGGNVRTESREVLGVPGIDCLGLRLDRAVGKEGVVDGATDDAKRGRCLKRFEVFVVIETRDGQPRPHITKEQHRFVAVDALPAGPAGERRIDFR